MGREVRKVPADWQHPKDERGRYVPLFNGPFSERAAEWDKENAEWEAGTNRYIVDDPTLKAKYPRYDQWNGQRPNSASYMPEWSDAERTHFQMYENTSEGTPISPVFATPEELARWLADNRASAFAGMTATYEQWLNVAYGGYAPSMVVANGQMVPGVAIASTPEAPRV